MLTPSRPSIALMATVTARSALYDPHFQTLLGALGAADTRKLGAEIVSSFSHDMLPLRGRG